MKLSYNRVMGLLFTSVFVLCVMFVFIALVVKLITILF